MKAHIRWTDNTALCGRQSARLIELDHDRARELRADPNVCRSCIRAIPPQAYPAGIPGKTAT